MANTTTSSNTANKRKKSKRSQNLKDISKINIKEVEEKLVQGRISLLVHQPFFGNMATRLRLIQADDWCETAATDGRNFYYNPAFIDSLTNKQTEFLFGHEVLHNVFEHLMRRDVRHPVLWNIAADYCVNQILIDNSIGKLIPDCLLDNKYKDWSAEQVYADLEEQYPNCQGKCNCGAGSDTPGDGDGSSGEQSDNSGDKQNKKQCTCKGGSLEDLIDRMLDQHLGNEKLGEEDGRPQLSESERQKIRDEIREGMLASAAQAAGKLPAGVKRLVDKLTAPKMNWRELLRQQVQSTITSNYSYMRPNRKTQYEGIVIPGVVKGDTISVCVAIDASGSISQKDVSDFLGEVEGLMSQYDSYEVRVWSFDTKVYNDQTFNSDSGDDISYYEVKGGGGTSFNANWEYMKDNSIEPKMFIMFTDGFTGDGWGDADYCESIFVIKHNTSCQAPHGISIAYEEE